MRNGRESSRRPSAGYIVLGIFALMLTLSVALDISLVAALCGGYVLFFAYALFVGLKAKDVFRKSLSGVRTVKNILITFLLIGILTGVWRACGTVASIVSYSASLIKPSRMVLLTFLLNCLISVLTGTAFGTAATMGTICMTMALAMGIPPLYIGGAVLAGAFFGDRCSPVSTSALLVAELTETDIYRNIKNMIKTAALPFALSAALYYFIGRTAASEAAVNTGLIDSFREQFRLGLVPLLPAAAILVLAFFKVNVKLSMTVSISAAVLISLFYQNVSLLDTIRYAVSGYEAGVPELVPLINGGGIVSMVKVFLIICISSCYSGIFEATGILDPAREGIIRLSRRLPPFVVMILVSVLTGMIACNQTLSIMLTNQLCVPLKKDDGVFAIWLEDTAVLLSPLIPWSIAGAVPLSSCGAPPEARLLAFLLYLIPLCDILFLKRKHSPLHP